MSLMGGLFKIPGSLVAAFFAPSREWDIKEYLLAELADRVGNLFNQEDGKRAYPRIARPGEDDPDSEDTNDTVALAPDEIDRLLALPRKSISE